LLIEWEASAPLAARGGIVVSLHRHSSGRGTSQDPSPLAGTTEH